MDMYQKRKMRKENREENSKKQDNLQQVNINFCCEKEHICAMMYAVLRMGF